MPNSQMVLDLESSFEARKKWLKMVYHDTLYIFGVYIEKIQEYRAHAAMNAASVLHIS